MMQKLFFLAVCLFAAVYSEESQESQSHTRYPEIEVDGKQYKLTLNLREKLDYYVQHIWTAKTLESGEVEFSEIRERPEINGMFFEDVENMATLLATYNAENNEAYYDGVISSGVKPVVVRSVPETDWWIQPYLSEEDVNDEEVEEANEEPAEEEPAGIRLRSAYVKSESKGKLEEPLSVLRPNVLAVVDYDLFKQLNEDVDAVFKYVATFWNAVDLKYRMIKSTEVDVRVTGIVIFTDEKSSLLNNARKYFSEQFIEDTKFALYDTAFVMTSSNVENAPEVRLGSICDRENSISFVQDDASFGGLLTVTHDLGHLLNLPHDGSDEAENCQTDSETENFMMARSVENAEKLTWSKCSNDILKEFARSENAECLN